MQRDRSADQRLELARRISQKEYHHDELAQEKRNIQNQIENFQNQMEQNFRLEEAHYEEFKETSDPLSWESIAFREVRNQYRD